MTLPDFVEYGGRVDSPAPFACHDGHLRALVLDADPEKLDALVERALTVPAAGATEYRAIGGVVLLQTGHFNHVQCLREPFDTWGTVREVVSCFWVPVLAGREHFGVFVADRFAFFAPFVFVDNPMSYAGGRGVHGFNKSQAHFEPATGIGPHVLIRAFGGNFTGDARAEWHPVLEIEQLADEAGAGAVLDGITAVAKAIVPELVELATGDEDIELPGFKLVAQLMKATLAGRGNQVFLKQFRDADDGTKACYQTVIEAGATFSSVKAKPVPHAVRLTVHDLDSHPIREELGIESQVARQALDCELSFTLERGELVGGFS